jgi:hypothetical protein
MRKNEPTGPSLSLALFLGLLSFCAGGALGIVSLVSQSVTTTVKQPDPEEIEPGVVYYIKGVRTGRTAWRAKEDAWRAGMVDVLRLSESELNQWSRERLDVKAPTGEEAPSEFKATLEYIPTEVNFRILEDSLQVATEIEFGGYLKEKAVVYQVVGTFQDTSKGIRFVPETGNLGSAPLGSVPVVRDWLFNTVKNRVSGGTELNWLNDSFGNLESVEIVDGQLVLRRNAES